MTGIRRHNGRIPSTTVSLTLRASQHQMLYVGSRMLEASGFLRPKYLKTANLLDFS